MTTILAVDTSTSVNTVAVCAGAAEEPFRVLAETVVECRRLHSERLLPTTDWILREAGLDWPEIDLLAVSIGPGSFTGLRIGAASWKGLAFARRLPLIGVSTLDAMSRLALPVEGLVCPMIDARMQEVYGAVYRFHPGARERITPERVCSVESLVAGLSGRVVILGDGARVYADRIRACLPEAVFAPAWSLSPRASAVAAEALELFEAGVPVDPALVTPVYIRLSQAEMHRSAARAAATAPDKPVP